MLGLDSLGPLVKTDGTVVGPLATVEGRGALVVGDDTLAHNLVCAGGVVAGAFVVGTVAQSLGGGVGSVGTVAQSLGAAMGVVARGCGCW